MPHKNACEVTLIGESACDGNLIEWSSTLVDQTLCEGNPPAQHPTMRRNIQCGTEAASE